MRTFALFFLLTTLLFSESANELDYYRIHFEKRPEHPLADTLFEKTVWKRKVSHLVLETYGEKHRVTLLMILEYPHNWKSQNYPIYYEYEQLSEALEKLHWLDSFLERRGVLRVHINGNLITKEEVLFEGYDFIPEKRVLGEE